MKIITKGLLKSEKVHQGTCRTCGCVFEFTEEEAELESFPRNESYWKLKCPTVGCEKILYIDTKP